jgi:hypothetical protein
MRRTARQSLETAVRKVVSECCSELKSVDTSATSTGRAHPFGVSITCDSRRFLSGAYEYHTLANCKRNTAMIRGVTNDAVRI